MGAGGVIRETINVVTLDSILQEFIDDDVIIGGIKSDTEGFEENVLRGGMKFFNYFKPKYIQMEVNKSMPRVGLTYLGLFNLILELGYEMHRGSFAGSIMFNQADMNGFQEAEDLFLILNPNAKSDVERLMAQ